MQSEKEHDHAITQPFDHEHRGGVRGSPSLDTTKISHVPGCGSREHGSRLRGAGTVSCSSAGKRPLCCRRTSTDEKSYVYVGVTIFSGDDGATWGCGRMKKTVRSILEDCCTRSNLTPL